MKFLRWLRKYTLYKLLKVKTRGARLILVSGNKILLVRHRTERFWVLPGGGVDKAESFEDAAIRECLEETGYKASSLEYLGEYKNFKEGKDDIIRIFYSENFKKIDYRKSFLDKILIGKIGWFNTNELPRTSSATSRRILEFQGRVEKNDFW